MKAINEVKKQISKIPAGKPFPATVFRKCASTDNIRQILNRLTKAGEIKRVARGVFVKPKHHATVGEILPPVTDVAKTLTKTTGESVAVHGAEAARQLQLTTQVPMQVVLYTSGNSRTLKIANRAVKLKHVSSGQLIASDTMAGLVLSALKYLGKENVTVKTIEHIKQQVTNKEFNEVLKLIEQMPTWLADVFYHYKQRKK